MNLDAVAAHLLPLYPRGLGHTPIMSSCEVPSKVVSIDTNGNCFLCRCAAWLPVTVGNILSFNSLEDIWNCSTAKGLQDDIAQKKYTYCAVKHCGVTKRDMYLHDIRYQISLDIDESCNLACPSCRTSQISHTKGVIFEEKATYINHFLALLDQFDKPLNLTMCGNGDPLASMSFRPLVLGWIPKVGQTAGQVRYNMSSQKMEISDGSSWIPYTIGLASIGLTGQAETILAWAAVKMEEDRTLKIKLEKYPTLKYAYDQYKMVEGLVYDSEEDA